MKMMARHTTDSEKVNLLLVCRVAYEVKQIPGIKIWLIQKNAMHKKKFDVL